MSLFSDGLFGPVIPDTGLLHRYDPSELSGSDGNSVASRPDLEQSDDLGTGSGTFLASGINSLGTIDYDGSSTDYHSGQFGSTISPPYDVFVVVSPDTTSGFQAIHDGFGNRAQLGINDGAYQIAPGNTSGGSATTDDQILRMKFRSSSIELEKEQSSVVSNTQSSNNLDGLTVAARKEEDSNSDAQSGEALVYDPDASGYSSSNVYDYLADKWGITL
jgi:hypothetical protein